MFPFTRKTVSDIKANFEAKKDTTPATGQHTQPQSPRTGLLANMSPSKRQGQTQKSVSHTIDTVLEKVTTAAPAVLRPAASGSRQPSWIGPKHTERAATPHPAAAMKHHSTIHFSAPGLQPPVYISTDLSEPQWEPVEMEGATDHNGEYRFSRTFHAEEGEYQYKIRLGPGDWWICDDSKPKVDDGAGNENNLHVVEQPSTGSEIHPAPLMPHESNSHPDHKEEAAEPVIPEAIPSADSVSPLFRHETLAPPADNQRDEDNDEPENPPLLRHESVSLTSHEQEHSPLFRHESIAIDSKYESGVKRTMSPRLGSRKQSQSSIPEEADPSDPSLERFPTDHRGIMEHLDRSRRSMQENEASDDNGSSPNGSDVAVTVSPMLPSVAEDGNEEAEAEQNDEEVNAKGESLAREEEIPLVLISEPSDRPAAPITPPLTPKEQYEGELDENPIDIRQKAKDMKEHARVKVAQAKDSGLSSAAYALVFAIVAASAAAALWYMRAKNDDIAI